MNTTYRNPYIGHPSQLLRINDYVAVDGAAHGMRATDVQNGPLNLTVCADKGMDFPYLSYRGVNMGYVAPCGLVASSYYDDKGNGFLRGFFAGFLTTCGLTYMGAAGDADGKHYGLHGRINNIPAEGYSAKLAEDETGSRSVISGEMRQGVLFGENLVLQREVTVGCGEKSFAFTDQITNRGFRREQHMILYHFNMGYPLLDESAELFIPHSHVEARDDHAKTGVAEKMEVPKPVPGYQEMCYFYTLLKDSNGQTFAGMYNHKLGFGVSLAFDGRLLYHFTQWKMVGEGEYALGLEPGNATPMGVEKEREKGHIKYLEPWESRTYRFTIRILEGDSDLREMRDRVKGLQEGTGTK